MNKSNTRTALRKINRGIEVYQKKLLKNLELLSEAEHKNFISENVSKYQPSHYRQKILRIETIISDLLTVKTAIKREKDEAIIYGNRSDSQTIYPETKEVLKKAGLHFEFVNSKLTFIPENELINDDDNCGI